MQDFPSLSRYLSLAHSPWTLIILVILFSLAVARILWRDATEEVARRIKLILGRALRHRKGSGVSPPVTIQEFAKALHVQLWEEFVRLDLDAPKPLAVSWRPVPLGEDHLDPALAGQDIAAVYEQIESRRLVILGAAGSGKSVLVQALAIRLLGGKPREGQSYDGPVPIIFGLKSWEPGTGLNEWLAGQLVALRYRFAPGESEVGKLLRNGRITPILDGFDEIDPSLRGEFLELLNKESSNPLILTSRSGEYLGFGDSTGTADRNSVFLERAPAIELMPLSLEGVCGYLLALPYRRGGLPAWQPVVDALKSPPRGKKQTVASLREALSVPLMVAIARDIYRQDNPAKLLQEKFSTGKKPAGKAPGRGTAEEYLLTKFVPAMYSSKQAKRPPWTSEQAERAFRYLATHLRDPQGRPRPGIAWWELGGAEKMSAIRRAILCGLAAGVVMVLANGTVTFAAVRGAGGLGVTPRQGIVVVLGNSTAIAVAFGLMHWLAAWRAGWVIKPSWVGLSIPWLRGNRTEGNRDLAREFGRGFAAGSIGGGVAVLGLLLSSLLVNAIGGGASAASVTAASPGWPATLLAGLGMTLIFGVTAGGVAALQAPVKIESAGGPLELLATDRRLALGGGAVAGAGSGAAIGLLIGLEQSPLVGLGFAVVACTTIWLAGAISVTAWGQWLISARLLLPLTGQLPWQTRAFLRDAHQRGVLRQSGAFYQFRHILLQELYAPTRTASPGSGRTVPPLST